MTSPTKSDWEFQTNKSSPTKRVGAFAGVKRVGAFAGVVCSPTRGLSSPIRSPTPLLSHQPVRVALPLAVSVAGDAGPVTAPTLSSTVRVEQVTRVQLCGKCRQPRRGHICTWKEGDDLAVHTKRKRASSVLDPVSGLGSSSVVVLTKQPSVLQTQKHATDADKKKKKDLLDYLAKNEKDYPVQHRDYVTGYLAMLNGMGEDEVRQPSLLHTRVRRFTAEQFELVDDPVLQTWKETFSSVLIQVHDHEALRTLEEECTTEEALTSTGSRSSPGKGKEAADEG